mmetsp:Transcript_68674/g.217208  ORF Transcript_68674/g.217208 Transcript_68674/m.217208 type:complete len:398 (+) Transcript_68674:259-1452(+)
MGCGGSKEEAPPKQAAAAKQASAPPAGSKPPPPKPTATPSARGRAQKGKVKDVYKIGRTLGTGGFAVVKLGVHKETKEEFAIKIMALPPSGQSDDPDANTKEDIVKEINILINLDHPNVIYLREFYEEGNKMYLVTELVTGGELLDAVLESGTYSESDARECFKQLMMGIEYLHSKNVVHRDLKLENLLLAKKGDLHTVKVADFGLAKKAAEAQLATVCGTPQYVAPEVIAGIPGLAYTEGVDMWSAGVVLYILLSGYPPFYDDSEPALFDKIRRGDYSFDDPVWDTISESAKDLVRSLLVVDPNKRLSASQTLAHKWITGSVNKTSLSGAQKNLRKNYRSKFRAGVGTVIAMNRMKHALAGLGGNEDSDVSADDMKGAEAAAAKYSMINVQTSERN